MEQRGDGRVGGGERVVVNRQQARDEMQQGGGRGGGGVHVHRQPRARAQPQQQQLPQPQPPPPPPPPQCPRCGSVNTKFCYYNNYSLTQPRHYCKTCKRYWTQGGALRNIPIGGTRRSRVGKRGVLNSPFPARSPQPTHPQGVVAVHNTQQHPINMRTMVMKTTTTTTTTNPSPPIVPTPNSINSFFKGGGSGLSYSSALPMIRSIMNQQSQSHIFNQSIKVNRGDIVGSSSSSFSNLGLYGGGVGVGNVGVGVGVGVGSIGNVGVGNVGVGGVGVGSIGNVGLASHQSHNVPPSSSSHAYRINGIRAMEVQQSMYLPQQQGSMNIPSSTVVTSHTGNNSFATHIIDLPQSAIVNNNVGHNNANANNINMAYDASLWSTINNNNNTSIMSGGNMEWNNAGAASSSHLFPNQWPDFPDFGPPPSSY